MLTDGIYGGENRMHAMCKGTNCTTQWQKKCVHVGRFGLKSEYSLNLHLNTIL